MDYNISLIYEIKLYNIPLISIEKDDVCYKLVIHGYSDYNSTMKSYFWSKLGGNLDV